MSKGTRSISYVTSKATFIWDNLFIKDGFSFKAEIQHTRARDTWKARKEEKRKREGIKERQRKRKNGGGKQEQNTFSV